MFHLAIDIGASGGRHLLGWVENGKLRTEEIYRFENGIVSQEGHLCWNTEALTEQVLCGLSEAKKIGKIPTTVAIDTWGVDYVLLDAQKRELKPTYAYRDERTLGVPEKFPLSPQELFRHTGIQTQNFNTVYQLYCDAQNGRLKKAKHFLMIPDYLSYRLTGKMVNEYTNATTTGMVSAQTGTWDTEILEKLSADPSVFLPLTMPSQPIGEFDQAVRDRVGYSALVLTAPSHDTASAVAGCALAENGVYISSGTWSLVGTENRVPILTDAAQKANFTNEGGVEKRYRFLKNIMGMWLFQNIRKNLDKRVTYDEMMQMAMESTYEKTVDPNDPAFSAPENMIDAIRERLGEPDLPIGDVLKSVYLSLAHSYRRTVSEIEDICQKQVSEILIVGGGSKDKYLNTLTSEITGKPVHTGLTEATASGNLLSQIMYEQRISLEEARKLIG